MKSHPAERWDFIRSAKATFIISSCTMRFQPFLSTAFWYRRTSRSDAKVKSVLTKKNTPKIPFQTAENRRGNVG